jgi:alpha-L-rhamnosidase
MGLLESGDWRARWVTAPPPEGRGLEGWTVYLRRTFELTDRPEKARVYLAARGLYQVRINGRRIGNRAITPDWSDYNARCFYQVHDLTGDLVPGRNTLSVILSGGWYAGSIGFFGQRFHYGRLPWFLGQLEMDCPDGLVRRVLTDQAWTASAGPIVSSDLMQGEDHDCCIEIVGWDDPAHDPDGWQPVVTEELDPGLMRVCPSPPLRETGELPARSVAATDRGWVVDFGQNMAGRVRARVQGRPGEVVRVRHGEVLDPGGRLYTENLRDAVQTDSIRIKDTEPVVFAPEFTLHGFRYVEIEGLAADPKPADFTARVVHSDLPLTGTFRSSDPELNRVWEAMLWGQKGNYVCVPTDCPQRDERLGWSGDAQLFAPLACYNMECAGFFRKFLTDLADGQSLEGGVPEVGPRISTYLDAAPAWGDAFVILPWLMYQMYGDRGPMEDHYESMERWMGYIERANQDGIRRNRLNGNYGDWVPPGAETDKVLIATAYWAECAHLMGKMARLLGMAYQAQHYGVLFERLIRAFAGEFIRHDRLTSDTQTAYVLALRFGLVTGETRVAFENRLLALLDENGGFLDTGIIGSAHLPEVLAQAGHFEAAYRLFDHTECPSLRHMVRHGATTIWERWDAWRPEVGFQDAGMNSFNHVALGSMGVWLYRWVAGIQVDEDHPGFSRFRLAPRPGGSLSWAEATYDSVRGRIKSGWERDGDRCQFKFEVPPNTEAVVDLPGVGDAVRSGPLVVGGGHHRFERTLKRRNG